MWFVTWRRLPATLEVNVAERSSFLLAPPVSVLLMFVGWYMKRLERGRKTFVALEKEFSDDR